MIYAYTGKTGSGKTWNMVRDAHKAWKQGRDIYSNTVLFFDGEKISWWDKLRGRTTRGKIRYFVDINEILEVHDAVILFDEAQVLFNARLWESLPEEFQYKCQQQRKHKLDLLATMQNMGTVDITYRRLVHRWWHHEMLFQYFGVGLFKRREKDVDFLYNTVDDLQVPDLKESHFWIGFWSRALYDTFYDIGFQSFKVIWIHNQLSPGPKVWIIPKKLTLANALSAKSTLLSACGLSRSTPSRSGWRK